MSIAVEPAASPPTTRHSGGRRRVALLAVAGVMLVVLGYAVGIHRSGTRVVTGPAYVGDRVVSMTAPDGTVYGFSESMTWIDADGAWHEDGWPSCLGSMRMLPSVTFGLAHVDYPNGASGDQVVYVDCRG